MMIEQINSRRYEDSGKQCSCGFTIDASTMAVINASLDAIVFMDEDSRICGCNTATYSLFGYAADELQGTDITILMPQHYAEKHKEYVRSFLVTGKAYVIGVGREVEAQRKDGSTFPIHLSLNVFLNNGKRFFAGFIRDLSAQKQASAALLNARDELEQRVEERTHELAEAYASLQIAYRGRLETEANNQRLQEGLRSAQRMEVVGRLSAGMAHDFNNVLANVLGYAQLVQAVAGDRVPAPVSNYLQEIERASLRGRDLVAQMLNFARGKPPALGHTSCIDAIQGIARSLQVSLPPNVYFEVKIPDPALPCAIISQGVLEQLLMNLCLNARDAMAGSGCITLSVTAGDTGTGMHCSACQTDIVSSQYVRFDVIDTGPGVPSDVLPRIFQPFFSTKDDNGTGLGLAMVDSLVHECHGHVTVSQAPQGGACFSLWLPIAQTNTPFAEQNLITDNSINPDCKAAVPERSVTILVVDDELTLVNLMLEALRHSGFDAVGVNSATAALELLSQTPGRFDLLMTDHLMPGVTGAELIQQARKIAPSLRTILCSGDLGYATKVNLSDVDAFIQKPMSLAETLKTIRQQLAQA